jgi:hypothetical protein
MNNPDKYDKKIKERHKDSVMIKPREMIPIMAQSADPLGSYTGVPAGVGGVYDPIPIQDADDL